MARKTHRARSRRKAPTAFQTIPELRKSFDYIDEFVSHRIQSGIPKEQLVKEVQREWLQVFSKQMEKKNATAFVEHQLELAARRRRPLRRKTQRRHRGGVAPFADPTTQAGIYLGSGLPPTANGAYPMANGGASVYGSLTSYLTKGLMNPPQPGIQADPVIGQSTFPSAATSPLLKGGARGRILRSHRARQGKVKGGAFPLVGSLVNQMIARPIPSGQPPPTMLHDAQSAWMGSVPGYSPDQVQHAAPYQLGSSMFPKMVVLPSIDTT